MTNHEGFKEEEGREGEKLRALTDQLVGNKNLNCTLRYFEVMRRHRLGGGTLRAEGGAERAWAVRLAAAQSMDGEGREDELLRLASATVAAARRCGAGSESRAAAARVAHEALTALMEGRGVG